VSKTIQNYPEFPWWLSIYNVFIGLIYITLSTLILALLNIDIQVLIDLLNVTLLLIGVSRILNGIFGEKSRSYIRILKTIIGIVLLVLGIIVFSFRNTNIALQILLITIGILVNSILRIIIGIYDKSEAFWFRIILLTLGSLTLIISCLLLIFPSWGVIPFIILLAISFILNGIARLNYAVKLIKTK
jgi:uncharacterized membrane protein HdeD (DUF308 family)